ncbi:aminotransferase class V-fold PLP-dependent enzyme, partial [Nocardia carnea]|uniref:aminotransferase class V-fold PLP-dependent enzyme n=1 Tax=Nocardia carnea TaxID=37328 RepID=UPI0032AE878B
SPRGRPAAGAARPNAIFSISHPIRSIPRSPRAPTICGGRGAPERNLLNPAPDLVYPATAARAYNLRGARGELPGVRVRDLGVEHSGIVSFTVDGVASVDVRDRLGDSDITVTVSHASSTLLDMSARGLDSVVRASPHCFVSRDELDRFVAVLSAL